jgi:hypothetical protein
MTVDELIKKLESARDMGLGENIVMTEDLGDRNILRNAIVVEEAILAEAGVSARAKVVILK